MDKDTSSMITTGARAAPVFDDNEDYAGSVQTFGANRPTEAALDSPKDNGTSKEEQDAAMLKQGMVWCNGRCQRYRHFSEFSVDTKNQERLCCHSYCKECRKAMAARQRQAGKL